MRKRAQGMPMETIIIAALVIIVLIVLVFIFTGKFNIFGRTTKSCVSQGGQCFDTTSGAKRVIGGLGLSCPEGMASIPGTDCDKDKEVCCINLLNEEK